jgi:hypothetical protein
MDGSLAIRNGCIYLVSARSGEASLALWPHTYQLVRSNRGVVGVADTATGRTLELGVVAGFGGGSAKNFSVSELEAPIPPACGGPAVYAEFSTR